MCHHSPTVFYIHSEHHVQITQGLQRVVQTTSSLKGYTVIGCLPNNSKGHHLLLAPRRPNHATEQMLQCNVTFGNLRAVLSKGASQEAYGTFTCGGLHVWHGERVAMRMGGNEDVWPLTLVAISTSGAKVHNT